MDASQRDQSIDRVLRQSFATDEGGEVSPRCVDAETFGAWMSGALESADAAAIEQHVSECGRCQAMLATFVRTDQIPVPASPWWQPWTMRWLVPIATAATVIAVWVAIPDRDLPAGRSVPAKPEAQAPSSAPAEAPPAGEQPAADVQLPAGPLPESGDSEKAARAPTAGEMKPEAPPQVQRFGGTTTGRPEPRSSSPADTSAPQRSERFRARAAERAAEETVTVTGDSPTVALMQREPVVVSSPDGAMRWRVLADGRLERGLGDGTWQPVKLPEPATITAGHSPATSVAWFVGPAGTIYLTRDGETFVRVKFTNAADLVAVDAANDREATVTTADGALFHTADGGATWDPR